MTISISDAEGNRVHSVFKFSDNAVQVNTNTQYWFEPVTITANIASADDIIELLMVTDAIRRTNGQRLPINLVMPYVPYARQDRVANIGEAHGARVFCDLINAQNYNSVEVWDAHSDVVPALLNRVTNVHCSEFVQSIATKNMTLVAPDAGAAKKVAECATVCGLPFIIGGKKRDTANGEITGTYVWANDIGNGDFLIVDDICDGGRTFIELAKLLRSYTRGKIMLYVTHAIMSKGINVFDGLIDRLYTANPFPGISGVATIRRHYQYAHLPSVGD